MTITRIEFIGFSVMGPQKKFYQSIKPEEHKGWTFTLEGPHLVAEGENRKIEIPRARCVVYSQADKPAADEKSAGRKGKP